MTIITLLTDFGLQDGYPGIMKGIIWKIAPDVNIVDLSHEIAPYDISGAALLLSRSINYFPHGTIHVAVVDPGVGTSRRSIAAQLGSQFFVGPDNGIFTLVQQKAEDQHEPMDFIHLDRSQYWLPEVSNSFHGRDIFAPVAAHIASGIPLSSLGSLISDPVRLEFPAPVRSRNGWLGQVIYIDHFGNISTNLPKDLFDQFGPLTITIRGIQIQGIVSAFGKATSGAIIALFDSNNCLSIAVVEGNASQSIQAVIGDQVEVSYQS